MNRYRVRPVEQYLAPWSDWHEFQVGTNTVLGWVLDGEFFDWRRWEVQVDVGPDKQFNRYEQLDVRLDILALVREMMGEKSPDAVAAILSAYPNRLDVVTLLGEVVRFVIELCEVLGVDREQLVGAAQHMAEEGE